MINLNFPNPVQDPSRLYGREPELTQFLSAFLQTSKRLVVIRGELLIGKTSFLTVATQRLYDESNGRIVPIIIPENISIGSFNEFATAVLSIIRKRLGKPFEITEVVEADKDIRVADSFQLLDLLTNLISGTPDRRLLLCLDDFDDLLNKVLKREGEQGAKEILKTIYTPAYDLTFPVLCCFTMSRLPDFVRLTSAIPLETLGTFIRLSSFERVEAQGMVRWLLGEQVTIDQPALDAFYKLADGHPYFIKLLLDQWQQQAGRHGLPSHLTQEMLNDHLCQAAAKHEHTTLTLENLWRWHFTREQQQLLLLAASRRGLTIAQLQQLGPEYLEAAQELRWRGYLTQDQGEFSLLIEYLSDGLLQPDFYRGAFERLEIKQLRERLDVKVEVTIDLARGEILCGARSSNIPALEYVILEVLCQNLGEYVRLSELEDALEQHLGENPEGRTSDSVDALVFRLRRKLGDSGKDPKYLKRRPDQFLLEGVRVIWPIERSNRTPVPESDHSTF